MDQLIALPDELLHSILAGVAPKDLTALSQTCHKLHNFVADNRPLFKDIYLNYLDDPEVENATSPYNYEQGIRSLIRLRQYCASEEVDKKIPHLEWVAQFVTHLVETSNPDNSRNLELLADLFSVQVNKDGFLTQSTLFQRARNREADSKMSKAMTQASAKLHVLYGVPILHPDGVRITRQSMVYPYAISIVYDLRNYTEAAGWGPFLDDGSGGVDWEKLEAVMVVLGHNLRLFGEIHNGLFRPVWATPFFTTAANTYMSRPIVKHSELPPPLDAIDPYHVSGTWMRVVCFLDFNELFAYNFSGEQPGPDEPRPPLHRTEAIRLLVMEFEITKVDPPGEDDSQDLPVVHFKGVSRSMHDSWDPNANSNIRGYVRKTKHGDVHWTAFSIYEGEERWRSESIQIGGLNSARGCLGNWFDKDFDIHGPAGPTAFWKISDEVAIRESDNDDLDDSEEEVGAFVEL